MIACGCHATRSPSRRAFLASLAATCAGAAIPGAALARSVANRERVIWIANELTGEEGRIPFTLDGETVYMRGYNQLCWLLRDTHVPARVGDVRFDINAIEALWEVQRVLAALGVNEPIVVHSGYRSYATNTSVEGATFSYHLRARAVDFHIPGVSMEYAAGVAASRGITGGLGYYPGSHIHIDSGPRRYWVG